VAGKAPDFANHRRRRGAFQSLFHGPEAFLRVVSLNEDHPLRIEPEQGKARRIGKPRLMPCLTFENPQDGPLLLPGKPRSQSQSEARGRGAVMRPQGDYLMQSPAHQPIRQSLVEAAKRILRQSDGALLSPVRPGRPMAQSEAGLAFRGFEKGDPRAQKIHPFRLARHHRLAP